jgi:uncharacterized membrane protein
MQPLPKRAELDRIAEHYALDAQAVDALLDLADARPGLQARLNFLSRLMSVGGLLSLAAGVVFFVAANWSAISVFGRFALLEVLLVICVLLALIKPPPHRVGHGALFLAFVVTGSLLALFGQTYQTGADIYELFLTWALLGLPFVLLANWSVTSAAWILVFNTALMLFCGWRPTGGLLWALFDGPRFSMNYYILAAAWLNVVLWFGFEFRRIDAMPEWVRRLLISCAFAFATWAGVGAIDDRSAGGLILLGVLIAMATVVIHAYGRRTDIYPLAVVMGSFIIVSMAWLGENMGFNDESVLGVLAVWLIGTSTAAGRILAVTSRRWRKEGVA